MNTETVSFEIPQAVLASLKVDTMELARNIRLLAAIDYFRDKKLSLGKAAELAGMGRLDFMDIQTMSDGRGLGCGAGRRRRRRNPPACQPC